MKVCGVELKGNDLNLCLLSLKEEVFQVPDCRARRLTLASTAGQEELKHLQTTFAKLMEDYKVDKVIIRQRHIKGKFAGGAMGFKIEAALELIDNLQVLVMSTTDIKESLRRTPVHIPFAETGLKIFQETAFETAFAYLTRAQHKA